VSLVLAWSEPGQDDGESLDYKSGGFAKQTLVYTVTADVFNVSIAPVVGSYAKQPNSRAHSVHFRGIGRAPLPSSVVVNGKAIPTGETASHGVSPRTLAPVAVVLHCGCTCVAGEGTPGFYLVASTSSPLTLPVGTLVVNMPSYPIEEAIALTLVF
jgi:hypothetical protein